MEKKYFQRLEEYLDKNSDISLEQVESMYSRVLLKIKADTSLSTEVVKDLKKTSNRLKELINSLADVKVPELVKSESVEFDPSSLCSYPDEDDSGLTSIDKQIALEELRRSEFLRPASTLLIN